MSRHVLGELEGAARGRVEAAPGGAAVEALADAVAVRLRHGPVEKAARDQLDVGTGARQRRRRARGRRAACRPRDRRLDPHRRRLWRLGAPALLLRREHERPRAPARLPRRDRATRIRRASSTRCWCSTTPPTTARRRRCAALDMRRAADRARARDRQGGERLTLLLRRRAASYCLLLNEDSELRPGAAAALLEALEADPTAAVAGAQLLDPDGEPQPCAWRFPGSGPRLPGRCSCTGRYRAERRRRDTEVGWVQSSAMLVRRERRRARSATSTRRSSSTPTRPTSAEAARATPAGGSSTSRRAGPSTTSSSRPTRRPASGAIVEFHRNRDLYMRKHHGPAAALAVRVLTAWSYAVRALAALVLPGHRRRLVLAPRPPGAAARRGRGPARGAPPNTTAREPPSRTSSAAASAKACVCRSTSASVVCGQISAMLWNGVMRTPRLSR